MSAALMVAVNCVLLTNVVVLALPPHVTVETPVTKLVPLTVIVKPAPPAVAELGDIDVVVGAFTGTSSPVDKSAHG
jgi:hypothetical protein